MPPDVEANDTGPDEIAAGVAGPLHGCRVVELAMWVAGPSAAGTLADWGADVIKIEPPRGGPQREIFGAIGIAAQVGRATFRDHFHGRRQLPGPVPFLGEHTDDVLGAG